MGDTTKAKRPRYRLSLAFRNPGKYLRKQLNHYRRVTLKEPERMFEICNGIDLWRIRNGVISHIRLVDEYWSSL